MRRLKIVYAVETLRPPRGGAERSALELLARLAGEHAVVAVYLAEPGAATEGPPGVELHPVRASVDGPDYWGTKRRRREVIADEVAKLLVERGADVVATALHAGPGAVEAATVAGTPAVLFLHSYEGLCKHAFDLGTRCSPDWDCVACPSALALEGPERAELRASREAHRRALADAAELIAPSACVARACEAWAGRRPHVAHPVPPSVIPARAERGGPLVLAAARWSPNKGLDLLDPLADALAPHSLAITEAGLPPLVAERLGRRPRVHLVPNAPLSELLDGAAALLVPSQWEEPFGRIAYEGMAAGVPTLAAGVGGLREFVPAEQLVDPPGDAAGWRAAVDGLLDGGWERARRRGRHAAEAIAAADPLGRVEAILTHAAASTGSLTAAGGTRA